MIATVQGLRRGVRQVLQRAVAFVYPPLCVLCNGPCSGENAFVCTGCTADLERHHRMRKTCPVCGRDTALYSCTCRYAWDEPFISLVSVYNYTDALQGIIHGFKYRGYPRLAWHMGRMAARLLPRRVFAAADLVVPVPLHRLRRMQRGYNQAEMIARGMCVQAGIAQRFAAGVCIRRRRTRTQTHLSAHQRHTNCSGAFFVPDRARARLQGARVLLVDDVVTTGATVRNCTYALQQAGCREVRVLCLARG